MVSALTIHAFCMYGLLVSLRDIDEAEVVKVAEFYISMSDLEHRYVYSI